MEYSYQNSTCFSFDFSKRFLDLVKENKNLKLLDLVKEKQNWDCLVKFEFQINEEYFFSIGVSHAISWYLKFEFHWAFVFYLVTLPTSLEEDSSSLAASLCEVAGIWGSPWLFHQLSALFFLLASWYLMFPSSQSLMQFCKAHLFPLIDLDIWSAYFWPLGSSVLPLYFLSSNMQLIIGCTIPLLT